MYNFGQVGPDRKWLQEILLSESDSDDDISDEDEYIRAMLKDHVREQKLRAMYYQHPKVQSLFSILFCYNTNNVVHCRTPNTPTTAPAWCPRTTRSTSTDAALSASSGRANTRSTTRR